MRLDDIDKQIVRELYNNGRESLTTLNKRVFKIDQELMSHTGIKKRISKLQDSGVLRIQGNLNVSKLNYKAMFILLEMQNYDEVKNIIKAYTNCPRVLVDTTNRARLVDINSFETILRPAVVQPFLNTCTVKSLMSSVSGSLVIKVSS